MKTKPTPRIEYRLLLLLAAIGCGVIALFQAPGLFDEPVPNSPEFAENRERIAGMTQSERDRIKRRAEKFTEMSEPRRDELRKLHIDLQTSSQAAELRKILKRYNDWLTSLSLTDRKKLRDDLSKAKTPAQQREIVSREKKRVDDERLLQSAHWMERDLYKRETDPSKKEEILARLRDTSAYGSQRSWGPTLDPDELDTVITVIAGELKPSPAQLAQWGKMKPQQRRLKIMTAALQEHAQRRRKREPGKGDPGKGDPGKPDPKKRTSRKRDPGLLSDFDLRQPLEEGIKDPALRDRLLKKPNSRRRWSWWSNYSVLLLVRNSIDHQRRQTHGNPTDEQLSQFFQTLNDEQKERLTQQPDKKRLLRLWYFFSGGENGEDYKAFHNEFTAHFRPPGFRTKRPGPGPKRSNGPGRRGGRGRGGERPRMPPE